MKVFFAIALILVASGATDVAIHHPEARAVALLVAVVNLIASFSLFAQWFGESKEGEQ